MWWVRSTTSLFGRTRCNASVTSVTPQCPLCTAERQLGWRGARQRLADLLREHEAHVLLDDLELGDVGGAAALEELDEALHQLLRRARAGGDADGALALEPLLAHLQLVVDQVRVGPVVARHLDEPI